MSWVLGVDPGLSGGFAIVHETGELETWSMPKTEAKIIRLIEGLADREGTVESIFLEDVWGRAGNSARSNTTFMKHTGGLRGCILTAFDIKRGGFPLFREVKPKTWQSDLGTPKAPKEPKGGKKAHIRQRIHKNNLKDFAANLWPDHKFTLLTCDAALIAKWGALQVWESHE